MTDTIDRYKIEKAQAEGEGDLANQLLLCPWTLSRDSREIAHFTTETRAVEYRDWLIERRKDA